MNHLQSCKGEEEETVTTTPPLPPLTGLHPTQQLQMLTQKDTSPSFPPGPIRHRVPEKSLSSGKLNYRSALEYRLGAFKQKGG